MNKSELTAEVHELRRLWSEVESACIHHEIEIDELKKDLEAVKKTRMQQYVPCWIDLYPSWYAPRPNPYWVTVTYNSGKSTYDK